MQALRPAPRAVRAAAGRRCPARSLHLHEIRHLPPREQYERLHSAGVLQRDPRQEHALAQFSRLHDELHSHDPRRVRREPGVLARLLGSSSATSHPRGIYLYGGVGCGKTMCMVRVGAPALRRGRMGPPGPPPDARRRQDMFFHAAPTPRKRRTHFHSFMLDVHQRMHRLRTAVAGDPVPHLAEEIAAESHLLAFDEFQVTDIADATIMRRLFGELIERGTVVVATSNRHPDHLYEGGLNRALFLPFIDLLKDRCDVVAMEDGPDYRMASTAIAHTYNHPLGEAADRELDRFFAAATGRDAGEPRTIAVAMGRRLHVPDQANSVARFSFDDLFNRPLGAADYMALCRAFHTLIVHGVPRMAADDFNIARRFITFLDVVYEHNVRLVVAAEAPPEHLFDAFDNAAAASLEDSAAQTRDGVVEEDSGAMQKAAQASGLKDIAFAYSRAVSRLTEIQSEEYLDRFRQVRARARARAGAHRARGHQPSRHAPVPTQMHSVVHTT